CITNANFVRTKINWHLRVKTCDKCFNARTEAVEQIPSFFRLPRTNVVRKTNRNSEFHLASYEKSVKELNQLVDPIIDKERTDTRHDLNRELYFILPK
ncbi:3386_t:CDS:2, partial [Entrophospora sp. SA101]